MLHRLLATSEHELDNLVARYSATKAENERVTTSNETELISLWWFTDTTDVTIHFVIKYSD